MLVSLDGRPFQVAVTHRDPVGDSDSFMLQIARPGYAFPPCSAPSQEPNTGLAVGPLPLDADNYAVP